MIFVNQIVYQISSVLEFAHDIFYEMGSIIVIDTGTIYISLLAIEVGTSFLLITLWGFHSLTAPSTGGH